MLIAHLRDILRVRVKTQNNGSLTVTFLCFASLVAKYLNGKLDDDTKYAVFQRSFHTVDDYENEGFIIFTTNKDNTAAVVAGVVVPLIVVADIVVVVVLYIRRRNRDKAADGEHVPMNSKPSGISESSLERSPRFSLFKERDPGPDSDFKRNRARFEIEIIHRRWDVETE